MIILFDFRTELSKYKYRTYTDIKSIPVENIQGLSSDQSYANQRLDTKSSVEKIRQNLKFLLSTEPGDIYFNPLYGVPLRHIVFEPNISTNLRRELIEGIQMALDRWEPRVELTKVDVESSRDFSTKEVAKVYLEFTVIRSGDRIPLEVSR